MAVVPTYPQGTKREPIGFRFCSNCGGVSVRLCPHPAGFPHTDCVHLEAGLDLPNDEGGTNLRLKASVVLCPNHGGGGVFATEGAVMGVTVRACVLCVVHETITVVEPCPKSIRFL